MILNRISSGFIFLISILSIVGCSRKKDTFINRNWHAVTAEYNTLYNGNVALEQGKKQIDQGYNENFWDILPVEKMQVSQEILLPGSERNEFFRVSEDKATKAIQKHSMLIAGKENNPQIDESYLLLGKSRYYDQRFIPALEAFNYILYKYPASNTINHAQIWREKTNIRLQNNELAIKNLKRLLEFETLKDQDRADANAILAQAYINTNALDSAVAPMKTAANFTKITAEEGRYNFILGQLYNRLSNRDSANYAFDKVIRLNRRSPREYYINAYLGKARNFNFDTGNPEDLMLMLSEMEENRENRDFLDKIYFQIGEYYNHEDSIQGAIDYYNRSLRTQSNDSFLQSVNYETLGDINFDNANFRNASVYYDSTLTKIPTTTRDYFFIKRKRDNLQDVIKYEAIADKNDSILKLVDMGVAARETYFTNYADSLKTLAIAKAIKGEVAQLNTLQNNNSPISGPGLPPSLGVPNAGNLFYFYNPTRVANGLKEFLRVWGPRKLQDNWRYTLEIISNARVDTLNQVSEDMLSSSPEFDPQTYISRIPVDAVEIDSLKAQRNDAYYRLGLVYREKFQEDEMAKQKLEALLTYTNEERLVVPANYYLYQIYDAQGDRVAAEKYKQDILAKYPDSRYAASIKNPGLAIEIDNKAEDKYQELFKRYEQGEYVEVLELSSEYLEEFNDDELLPKIELLKALATGRLVGFDAYRLALKDVALKYPETESGKKAQDLLTNSLPALAANKFKPDTLSQNMKLLYEFPYEDKAEVEKLKEKVEKAITELNYKYTTSIDIYSKDVVLLVVHGIGSRSRALGFEELLRENKIYAIEKEPIVISSENYKVALVHKTLEDYKNTSVKE